MELRMNNRLSLPKASSRKIRYSGYYGLGSSRMRIVVCSTLTRVAYTRREHKQALPTSSFPSYTLFSSIFFSKTINYPPIRTSVCRRNLLCSHDDVQKDSECIQALPPSSFPDTFFSYVLQLKRDFSAKKCRPTRVWPGLESNEHHLLSAEISANSGTMLDAP
jgi:hypothetical protein